MRAGSAVLQSSEVKVEGVLQGQQIPYYLMSGSLFLSVQRELYEMILVYRKHNGQKDPPWGTLQNATHALEENFETMEERLVSVVGDWKKWRYSLFEIKDLTSRNSGKFRLEDSLRNDRNREWLSKKRDNNGDDWLDVPVMQEDLRKHYERLLVVYELIPMLKPFAGQIRLVPGNEGMLELPLIKGLFEKTIEVGPFSSWLTGQVSHQLTKDAYGNLCYPDGKKDDIFSFGMRARMTDVIKQIEVQEKNSYLKWPEGDYSDYNVQEFRLPEKKHKLRHNVCGIFLSFFEDNLAEFRVSGLNSTYMLQGPVVQTGAGRNLRPPWAYNSGGGLCGLYSFKNIYRFRKDAVNSRGAFTVRFEWTPTL